MTLSDQMERALLDYFAKDDGDERTFQSLTTIYETVSRPAHWRESFFSDLEGVVDKDQLKVVLDQLVIDGLLQKDWGKDSYEPSYRATEEGIYESVLGLDGYLQQRPSIKPIEFNPDDWTGPQSMLIDAKVWSTVKETALALQLKCRTTNFRSEEDQKDIQNMADALVSLCNMAEPDPTLIDIITAHPKFKAYAGLAVFVATIRGALGI